MKSCDRKRILVADDEADIRELFLQVISCELHDCRVDVAVNGAEALAAFREANQAVLLLDIHMPVMDGLKAYREIKKYCEEEDVELPAFVFCTGFEPPREIQNIIAANAKHCVLHKPVNNDTLVEAMKTRLDV